MVSPAHDPDPAGGSCQRSGYGSLSGKSGARTGNFAVAAAWLSRAASLVFLDLLHRAELDRRNGLGRLLLNTQCLASQYSEQCSANKDPGAASDAGADRGNRPASNTTWVDPWVGGVELVHQPYRLVRRAGRLRVRGISLGAGAEGGMAGPCSAPGVRLATANQARQPVHGPIAFSLLILAGNIDRWSRRSGFAAGGGLRWPRRFAGTPVIA